jgi:hypothetical protein
MFTRHVRMVPAALLAASSLVACGAPQRDRGPLTPSALVGGAGTRAGIAMNGIAMNGIAMNGIAMNGIAMNGMTTNGLAAGEGSSGLAERGLTQDALASPEFAAWFAQDPTYASMVMRYVARCALGPDQALSFEQDGASWSWTGTLAVAPRWAAGGPIAEAEQQLVSACLAAHVNGLGHHVSLSVRGYLESGETIALAEGEVEGWTHREACFFGNLFDGSGVWNALEPDLLDPAISTPRGCAAEFGVPQSCPPMVRAGMCADVCSRGPDGTTWVDCVVGDVHYRPVEVSLRDADVYRCGDGVCQDVIESAETCPADCMPAPSSAPGTDGSAAPPPDASAPSPTT